MPKPTKQAPRCRYCGKRIAKSATRVWLRTKADVEHSPHVNRGDIIVDRLPQTITECAPLTNGQVLHVWRNVPARGGDIYSFSWWDGESYDDKFFCKGEHARAMGYLAAKQGMLTKSYAETVAKEDA
jgi:hypothetical protein